MAHARARSVCGTVTLCAALLAGCTGDNSAPGGETKADPSPGASRSGGDTTSGSSADTDAVTGDGALPAVSPTQRADPAKQPRTAAEAAAFVRKTIADPELVGSGAVRAAPYESDPRTWAVLGSDCAWQRQGLPKDVLATLTRHFEVPAADGAVQAVRLSTTVTVHRTALDAAWEDAGMLEEAVGCPAQTLRPGERLTGLTSTALAWGEGGNVSSDDSLSESGECVSDTRGGPYAYSWTQALFGSVVVSASVCGGRKKALSEVDVAVRMLLRVQTAIGSPTGTGSASPEPDPAPSTESPGVKDAEGGE